MSLCVRLLGGKLGTRVYLPGTGPSMGDYHLLDIGNDVVFGSRSHLVTSDSISSERIRIGDGAMVADRVCLLPGVTIGANATMGSGAVTRRGKTYPASSVYVGSRGGDGICLSTGSELASPARRIGSTCTTTGSDECVAKSDGEGATSSPFGRAFYLRQAPYHVLGPIAIFAFSSFMVVFTAFFWNVPVVTAVQTVDHILRANGRLLLLNESQWFDVPTMFILFAVFTAIFTVLQAVLALAVVVAAKWILLGRRQPGNYDWDKSSYCQRWQLFLTVEKLRRQCFRGHGILGLLTGTHWLVLYFRALGAKIGDDCALFVNGRPSLLFTEPDLLTLGERVVVDDASLVSHINTKGKFDLNRLEVEDDCVLRTGSRLLSGATMRQGSCLLEHTLIMGGDTVNKGVTMQGWPAERLFNRRLATRPVEAGTAAPAVPL